MRERINKTLTFPKVGTEDDDTYIKDRINSRTGKGLSGPSVSHRGAVTKAP